MERREREGKEKERNKEITSVLSQLLSFGMTDEPDALIRSWIPSHVGRLAMCHAPIVSRFQGEFQAIYHLRDGMLQFQIHIDFDEGGRYRQWGCICRTNIRRIFRRNGIGDAIGKLIDNAHRPDEGEFILSPERKNRLLYLLTDPWTLRRQLILPWSQIPFEKRPIPEHLFAEIVEFL